MVEQVHSSQWQNWVGQHRAVVVDVREPFEWSQGTLPDAELVPMASLANEAGRWEKNKPVLLVCRSGARSQHAALLLSQIGFGRVGNLSGGVLALGLPG